jgi:hypothetical protein
MFSDTVRQASCGSILYISILYISILCSFSTLYYHEEHPKVRMSGELGTLRRVFCPKRGVETNVV